MRLLYFAWLRDIVGTAAEEVRVPDEVRTVAALIDWLASRSPRHREALAGEKRIRCALDQEFAAPGAALEGVEEVAFFPPVTGG